MSAGVLSGASLRTVSWLPLILLASVLISGCGKMEIDSTWRDRDIAIDGLPDEWHGARTYATDPNLAIGVMNDGDYLYLSLSTPVRSVAAQMAGLGFTVWLDPEGGKDKTFGIRCPVGHKDPSVLRAASQEPARIKEMFETSAGSLEILMPDSNGQVQVPNDGACGIEVALGHRDGTYGYELKVPLRSNDEHEYALDGSHGKPVGIGFETPQVDTDAMREAMGDRTPPGGGKGGGPPGGGGGRGGMPGGGMRGGRMPPGGMPENLEIWAKINLASSQE